MQRGRPEVALPPGRGQSKLETRGSAKSPRRAAINVKELKEVRALQLRGGGAFIDLRAAAERRGATAIALTEISGIKVCPIPDRGLKQPG